MSGISVLVLSLLALFPLACERGRPACDSAAAHDAGGRSANPAGDVLATVNGVPITELDVRLKIRSRGTHVRGIEPEQRGNVVETIIREELMRQRAVELGLDDDAGYREKRRPLEAQIDAFDRKELAGILLQNEIAAKTEVSTDEVRRYFESDGARIRTELHVWQILQRTEAAIDQAQREIIQGASFEEVARKQFPELPDAVPRPWDLGYLKWKQVPEAWRDAVYDMKPGDVSDVIAGPGGRFWLIKLIARREDPEATLDRLAPVIVEILKEEKAEALRVATETELREAAHVTYVER